MQISFSVAVSSLMAVAAASSLRSVAISEDTPPPGTSAGSYALCTQADLTPFGNAILSASNECAAKTSYNWNSVLLPTTAERTELCSCTLLINKLKTVKIPHCAFYRSGQLYSYAQIAQYAFGLCSASGGTSSSASSTSTPVATPTPTTYTPFTYTPVTYTPFTYTPFTYTPSATKSSSASIDISTSSSKRKSKSKLGLIVGVIAGVVGIGGIAGFVAKKHKQSDEEESSPADVNKDTQLSPLGRGEVVTPTAVPYTTSAPTPTAPLAKQMV